MNINHRFIGTGSAGAWKLCPSCGDLWLGVRWRVGDPRVRRHAEKARCPRCPKHLSLVTRMERLLNPQPQLSR